MEHVVTLGDVVKFGLIGGGAIGLILFLLSALVTSLQGFWR